MAVSEEMIEVEDLKLKFKKQRSKLKRWRDFLLNVFGDDKEDEHTWTLDEFCHAPLRFCEELSGIEELSNYGISKEDVEIVLRLKKIDPTKED